MPDQPKFASIRPETLSHRVALELVKSILSGEFAPGELLPTEEQLCQQLGVSRSVIRESVKAVAALGMVESRQGRGTVALSRENWNDFASELLAARAEMGTVQQVLVDLMSMRRALEADAAASTAAVGGDLTEAEAVLEKIENLDSTNPEDLLLLDVEFHEAVIRAAGNDLVIGFFHRTRPMLILARQISYEIDPERIAKGFEEHASVLKAIKSGDPKLAYDVMFQHLSSRGAPGADDNGYPPPRRG